MSDGVATAGAAAVALGAVHLFAARIRFLDVVPRSRWLSFAGGVSVAYVFVHLLPELAEAQRTVEETGAPAFLEQHAYLLSLVGLAVFYGVERAAAVSRRDRRRAGESDETSATVFWLGILSFAVYNALIGYLLRERLAIGVVEFLFYAVAMGLHFAVNDYGLRAHHGTAYRRLGRWLLAASLLVGWGASAVGELSPVTLAVTLAILSGGVVVNVLKEELPEDRKSRFYAFAVGAAAYSAVLLAA